MVRTERVCVSAMSSVLAYSSFRFMSLGYQLGGWLGALLAVVAFGVPPLVMLPATMASRRFLLRRGFAGIVRGAAVATAGLLASTVVAPEVAATPWCQIAIGVGAVALTYQGRRHPGWWSAAARPSASSLLGS